ncbi:hypothetical protein JF546_12945 [Nitratireductor aquimarinus]|uniref:hypothetical protein n=1 Tax=Nitratireductor aquimarinus TaxID=889300 RepID=UPI001A8F09AA|nr:hypothetical protein [Nitratireductor aquimarinus]MBN8243922.1 hypothetical protein [Nitratireductor aquimarinus]MBY6131456.1 hypothetical protein [Nitratireductor aquimarinus]MCA1300991.1 hypothetical protein [Nitratireductor aquimarinus]
MKLFVSGVLLATLLASGGYFSDAVSARDGSETPLTQDALAGTNASEFTLMRIGFEDVCKLRRADTSGEAQLALDSACAQLVPALAGARVWQERADGTVAFLSASGETLVEFFPGDGVTYESLRPSSPLLSLYRED